MKPSLPGATFYADRVAGSGVRWHDVGLRRLCRYSPVCVVNVRPLVPNGVPGPENTNPAPAPEPTPVFLMMMFPGFCTLLNVQKNFLLLFHQRDARDAVRHTCPAAIGPS